jgi:UDP-glucuronate 4-epimerase
MKILITGVAGFIGFNAALYLLKKKHIIYGIDNFDKYYSLSLKKKRIFILKKNNNFKFKKLNICNFKMLDGFLKKKNIFTIIHLAAQAGVRYSLKNPKKYIDTNIKGFFNVIESSKFNHVKKIIYASSSSVYGDSTKFPLKETEKLNPKNIYGLSKKINEEMADIYQKQHNIKFIGIRFFTVFGEWGRPDMFMFKLFRSFFLKNTFYLNNFGNHLRDFTYIDDVVKCMYKLIYKNFRKHEIFNICSNKPINIYDVIKNFEKKNKIKLRLTKLHKADVLKTHGDNKKLLRYFPQLKFSNFYDSFYKTFEWYKKNRIHKF